MLHFGVWVTLLGLALVGLALAGLGWRMGFGDEVGFFGSTIDDR